MSTYKYIPAGLLSYEIVLVSVGAVVSVAVFPIGLALLITVYCCCRGNGSGHKWTYAPSPSIGEANLVYIQYNKHFKNAERYGVLFVHIPCIVHT